MDTPEKFQLHCPRCGSPGLSRIHPICKECGRSFPVEGRILVLEDDPSDDYGHEGANAQFGVLDQHFWFSVRRAAIVNLVKKKVETREKPRFMELGCSNGYVLAAIESTGWDVLGVDMHLHALRRAQTATEGEYLCALMENVDLSQRVEAVGLFDVIEHIDDDVSALEHAKRQLNPGGFLVVTVPGLGSLWSDFDRLLGHKRRYSVPVLKRKLEDIGMETIRIRYLFSYAVPLVWLQRKILRRKARGDVKEWNPYYRPPHPIVNKVLGACGIVESALAEKGWNPPFGTSVIALARKP
jgi:SAM-dependent methyltransferase